MAGTDPVTFPLGIEIWQIGHILISLVMLTREEGYLEFKQKHINVSLLLEINAYISEKVHCVDSARCFGAAEHSKSSFLR